MSTTTFSAERNGLEVAIVGMAGRFPGAANIEQFWHNVSAGQETITFFREQELLDVGVDPQLLRHPDYVRARGIMENIDLFDADFFGYNAHEAELMDPQQRIFLETAWEALEHAGYDPAEYAGLIGVYAGTTDSTYLRANLWPNQELQRRLGSAQIALGNGKDHLAARTCYKLDLKGPGVNVQTACSTSLVAVHMACRSLLHGECDMALAGGVSITVPHISGYLYREGGTVSPDGHCRAFDAQARGMIDGNGVGIVVLKRLEDALNDGDTIHAIVKGSAINNDGALKVGYTAPGIEGQAQVIRAAHLMAEVNPETIGYVEAHGTGTALGDPIEVMALTRAFREESAARQFCALGSVKTNIGHLDVAAGVTGLIKTVCALKARQLPPSLHFVTPNPEIDFASSPFYVNTSLRAWPEGSAPRRAGVSSFGIGGTNAHVLLEEAPPPAMSSTQRPWYPLVLAARTPTALQASAQRLAQHLRQHPELHLADVAWTLQTGRRRFPYRWSFACENSQEAARTLEALAQRPEPVSPANEQAKAVLFLFPGQGAQYMHMGRDLYQSEEVFREHLDICCDLLQEHLQLNLRAVLYPPVGEEAQAEARLRQTALTQPALFAVEYSLARLWMHWGVQPRAMLGHSVGEYVAACLAGVFSLEDALALVALRGQLMQNLPAGSMLAVPLEARQITPYLGPEVELAAINAPARSVLSGTDQAIALVEQQLEERGVRCSRLHTSHAFHSFMMEPMLETFTARMAQVQLAPPTLPYLSNLTGQFITAAQATSPAYWAAHLRQSVRFAEGLETALAAEQGWIALEVGPGQTLGSLLKLHPQRSAVQALLQSLRHPREQRSEAAVLMQSVGQFWQAGGHIDWSAFYAQERRLRVPLPTYPFERKRYWVEAPASIPVASAEVSKAALPSSQPSVVSATQEKSMSDRTQDPGDLSPQRARIVRQLAGIFADQLGLKVEEIDSGITFFELGADSLLLLQISQAVHDTFGVALPFRMLFEEVPTVDALSRYLEQALPKEAAQSSEPAPARPASASDEMLATLNTWPQLASEYVVPPATNGHNGANGNGHNGNTHTKATSNEHSSLAKTGAIGEPESQAPAGQITASPAGFVPRQAQSTPLPHVQDSIQQIVAQQLQLMARQLDLLQPAATSALPAPSQGESSVTIAVQQEPTAYYQLPAPALTERADGSKVDGSLAPSLAIDPETYVAYKPLQNRALEGLKPEQKQHIKALISRLTQKTGKSKQFAQEYRGVLADNRTSAGFNQTLKDITYSIVPDRAQGAHLWDIDGNEYVDITMGFGALLFGHSPDFLLTALEKQLRKGTLLGLQSSDAGEVARLICTMTGQERVTFCNSGTEAIMSALRFARAVTGRQRIALFSGSFHGTFDGVLVRGKEGANRQLIPVPLAPGVPQSMMEDVLLLRFGYQDSLDVLRAHAHELAGVLVELPQSRRPDLHPAAFLRELRAITSQAGTALIFDEVVTGFRTHPGGASAVLGVQPDLVTYGKAAGGGLPLGIVAGKALYMDAVDGGTWNFGDASYPRATQTFFAGTYFKHPLLMAGVRAIFEHMAQSGPQLQERLNARTERLVATLNGLFERLQVRMRVASFGSLFRFITPPEFKQVESSIFYYNLLDKGIYIPEGRSCFLSTAHTEEDIAAIEQAVEQTIREMRASGFFTTTPGKGPGGGQKSDPLARTSHNVEGAAAPSTLAVRQLPTTEEQKELWVLSQLGEESSTAYNELLALDLRGQLQVSALYDALRYLLARHEALRTTFSADGEQQRLYADQPLAFPVHDMTSFQDVQPWLQRELGRPFDLEHGPLWRVSLLKIHDQHHVLMLTFHHIIIDGWSAGTLLEELSIIYKANCSGQSCQLPAALQYSDYVRWKESQDQAMHEAETFWTQQFADTLPVLQLPTDRPRPQLKSYRGARKSLLVPGELGQKIKRASARKNVSFFGMLLSLFAVFLHQLSGQDDLVVGVPVAGQMAMEGGNFLGHAANLVLVRSHLNDPQQPFHTYLAVLKKTLLQANKQQIYPFLKLVKTLNPQRDASRLSLVAAMFNLDRGGKLSLHGLEARLLQPPQQTARYDISFNITESRNGLLIDCDYDTDLFDASTIERWLLHYQDLLSAIAEDSEQPVATLPLLTAGERELLLKTWNETSVAYDQHLLIHQLFEQRAILHPEKIALRFRGKALSYGELNQRAERLADVLRARGVGPHVLVGICTRRSLEMLVGLLAILKAGGAYVPLDPAYPAERIAFVLEDTQAPLLLTQRELRQRFSEYQGQVIELDDVLTSPLPALPNGARPGTGEADQLAYVIYTSGSTGKPKGVMLSHRNVTNFFVGMDQRLGAEPAGVWLAVTSISFDISVLELFWTLTRGFEVVLQSEIHDTGTSAVSESGEDSVAGHIARAGVTHLQCTPSLMQILLADAETRAALKKLRFIMLGGEHLPLTLARELRSLTSARLLNMYGPTETTIWSSTFAVDDPEQGITIGTPIANTSIYILDKQYRPVPLGVSGDLYIGGLGVARGYLKRPELTAERFIPDPFGQQPGSRLYNTGDLARYRPDGCIEYIGRSDSQVKLRGYRIELGEIEAALGQHPAVQEVAVKIWQDASGQGRIAAYVVLNAQEGVNATDLRAYLKIRLPEYMLPQSLTFLAALPLTANGKIDRKALPRPENLESEASQEYVAPAGSVEELLARLWSHFLRRERVGRHDNFFDLGGDSILALRIVTRAKEHGLIIQPRQIFQYQTIAELASLLPAGPVSRPGCATQATVPLTPIQHWFFEHHREDQQHFNMSILRAAQTPLDSRLLEKAFGMLVERHEALRLRFTVQKDGSWQADVNAESAFTFVELDYTSLAPSEAEAALAEKIDELQRSFCLDTGPLLSVAHIRTSARPHERVLIVVHHLAIDIASWHTLLEELQLCYTKLSQQEEPDLPPVSTTYTQWAIAQVEYARSWELKQETAYWLAEARGRVKPLPVDRRAGRNTEAYSVSKVDLLERKETDALHQIARRAYQTQLSDLILAALARVLADWTGQPDVLIEQEGHGREILGSDINPARTVGWLTAVVPLLLEVPEAADIHQVAQSIKEQMRALPQGGVGYGLLRYLGQDQQISRRLREQPAAEVSFNYIGKYAQSPRPKARAILVPMGEASGQERSLNAERRHKLEVTAALMNGRLRLEWVYSSDVYHAATIERLAAQLIWHLRQLCQARETGKGEGTCQAASPGTSQPVLRSGNQESEAQPDLSLANLSSGRIDSLLTKLSFGH